MPRGNFSRVILLLHTAVRMRSNSLISKQVGDWVPVMDPNRYVERESPPGKWTRI